MRELIDAFRALRHAPRALWLVILAFTLDGMAYFGILPLMKAFLGQDLGISSVVAGVFVSVFTGALTLVMLFVGKPTEQWLGLRKSLLLALTLSFVGRTLYCLAPAAGSSIALVVASLLLVAIGEGIVQPVSYAGIKQYTDEKSSAMGYAMLYAGMNVGAGAIGPISASVRTTWDAKVAAGTSTVSGFNAVNWVCTGMTLLTLVLFAITMTKRVEATGARQPNVAASSSGSSSGRTDDRSKSPILNTRFMFFIFALLPVRTLFAHQWLTMPEYVLRAYPSEVADKMEWLVDSVNPVVIVLGVPLITALTKRFHVVTMMIVGSGVSAAATFLLCTGPNVGLLIAYFVVFSIGEALWSSRFLQYAAEIAPEGRVTQYMGVANFPWFVAKVTTGFYAGFLLERFVPKSGPQHSEILWALYGAIAMLSPVALLLTASWLRSGTTHASAKEDAAAA